MSVILTNPDSLDTIKRKSARQAKCAEIARVIAKGVDSKDEGTKPIFAPSNIRLCNIAPCISTDYIDNSVFFR